MSLTPTSRSPSDDKPCVERFSGLSRAPIFLTENSIFPALLVGGLDTSAETGMLRIMTPDYSARVARAWAGKVDEGVARFEPERVSLDTLSAPRASAIPPYFTVLVNATQPSAPPPLRCPLEGESDTLGRFRDYRLTVQTAPYTEEGFLIVAPEHRSAVTRGDLLVLLDLSQRLPGRAIWYSGPNSGGSVYHHHAQVHRADRLGDGLPITHAPRRVLARISRATLAWVDGYALPALALKPASRDCLALLEACLGELQGPFNLAVVGGEVIIIPRTRSCASAFDGKKVGAAETLGCFVFRQPPDSIDYQMCATALGEVGLPDREARAWAARVLERRLT